MRLTVRSGRRELPCRADGVAVLAGSPVVGISKTKVPGVGGRVPAGRAPVGRVARLAGCQAGVTCFAHAKFCMCGVPNKSAHLSFLLSLSSVAAPCHSRSSRVAWNLLRLLPVTFAEIFDSPQVFLKWVQSRAAVEVN